MMIEVTTALLSFPAIATIVLILLVGGVLLVGASQRLQLPHLPGLTTATLLIGIVSIFFRVYTAPFLINDEATWHLLASESAAYLSGDASRAPSYVEGKEGYMWIAGSIYILAGSAPIVLMALNVVLHSLCVVTTVASAQLLIMSRRTISTPSRNFALTSLAAFLGLLPIQIYWVPWLLRETLSAALIAVVMYSALRMSVRTTGPGMFMTAVVAVVLWWVRGSLGIAIAVAVVMATLTIRSDRSKYRLATGLFLILISALLAPSALGLFNQETRAFDDSAANTSYLSEAASSGFPGLSTQTSLLNIALVTGPRVLFGPFPWEWSSSGSIVLAIGSLICWLSLAFVVVRGWRLSRRINRLESGYTRIRFIGPAVIPLLCGIAILLGLMFTVGNYGILARFRPMAIITFAPLAVFGFLQVRAVVGGHSAGSQGGLPRPCGRNR